MLTGIIIDISTSANKGTSKSSFYPLEISKRFWSGQRDSNPRPQPWQGSRLMSEVGLEPALLSGQDFEVSRLCLWASFVCPPVSVCTTPPFRIFR